MKQLYHFPICILFLALFFLHCSDDGDTAGSTSETDIGLYGTIVDEDGNPVEDVQVVVFQTDPNVVAIATTETNKIGKYNFEGLESNRFIIHANKEIDDGKQKVTYGIVPDTIYYNKEADINVGSDTLYALRPVVAYATLETGEAPVDIEIKFRGYDHEGTTDSSGRVIFQGVTPNTTYNILYQKFGFQKTDTTLTVELGKKLTDTLFLDTVKLLVDSTALPPTPQNISAVYDSVAGVVNIAWSPIKSPYLEGYIVYRKDASKSAEFPIKVSGENPITETSFQDTVKDFYPEEKLTLAYSVTAKNRITPNQSKYSVQKTVTLPPRLGKDFALIYYTKHNGGYQKQSASLIDGLKENTTKFLMGNIDSDPNDEITRIWANDGKVAMTTYDLQSKQWKKVSTSDLQQPMDDLHWFSGNTDHENNHEIIQLIRGNKQNRWKGTFVNYKYNGTNFFTNQIVDNLTGYEALKWIHLDYDSDGDNDLVQVWRSEEKSSISLFMCDNGKYIPKWKAVPHLHAPSDALEWLSGTSNSDNEVDLISIFEDSVNQLTIATIPLKDAQEKSKTNWIKSSLGEHQETDVWLLVDSDGDGDDDIIQIMPNSFQVYYVNDHRYTKSGQSAISILPNSKKWFTNDYDNDGDSDIIQIFETSDGNTGIALYSSNGGIYTKSWQSKDIDVPADAFDWLIDSDGNIIQVHMK